RESLMETTTMQRRDFCGGFAGGLLALLTGRAAGVEVPAGELPADLKKLVDIYGEDVVLRHFGAMLESGEVITFPALQLRLRRERRREMRQRQARERRERHTDCV